MRLLLLLLTGFLCTNANAQLAYTPFFPTETSGITIVADASRGNQGLLGHTSDDVYVHMGVITNLSNSPTDWKYSKFTWATTNAAAKATSLGNNSWSYNIPASLRSFFGITNSGETIQKIALLFRSGDGSRVLRNKDGSDMYIPVYGASLAATIIRPLKQATFIPKSDPEVFASGTYRATAAVNSAASLQFFLNGVAVGSAAATGANDTAGTNITLPGPGSYMLRVTATAGAASVSDSLLLTVGGATSPVAALPAGVRDGINYDGNTTATLVLRAPGKNAVYALGEFNNWAQNSASLMNKTPDGKFFWLRLTGLTAGTEYAYQYLVDDTIRIADPYAEKVLDPANDPFISATTYPGLKQYPAGQQGIVSVLMPGAAPYTWVVPNFTRPDKKGLVVYELLLRDFVQTHDWKTLRDTLPYLKKLGINAIELMPFNEFEGNESWGYNPSFYFAPDKYYGTATSLKQFIDACHQQGIAIIMDIALNHSFGQSPMVQLYWDRQNSRPAANNPWYNPAAKHAFNVGYDMNHESLDTRYFTSRVVEHWLQEYKIDGFRFDLSKGFTQVQTCDANGGNCNVNGWSAYDASRVAIWKRYYDSVQLKSNNAYVVLEHFADNNEEKELSNYGMLFWGNANHSYAEAAMGYIPGSNFSNVTHTARGWANPFVLGYMESHDEERITYKTISFGAANASYNTKPIDTALKRMQLDAAFFLTLPGPKMIWQFGELGYDFSINRCTDGTIADACRLANKPIRWDYLQDAKRKAVYDLYAKLIALRMHPSYRAAFAGGNLTYNLSDTAKWIKLTTDTSSLMVVGNFGISPTQLSTAFPTAGTWYNYVDGGTFSATGSNQTFALAPGAFIVYTNRNLTGNTPTSLRPVAPTDVQAAVVRPNPATGSFALQFTAKNAGTATVQLVNNSGAVVQQLHQSFVARGLQNLRFNRSGIAGAAGMYYLKITIGTSAAAIVPIVLQ